MKRPSFREKTRKERYEEKRKIAQQFPVEVACVNFHDDENVGYVIRAAACFGARAVNVIGKKPVYKNLKTYSASTFPLVQINQFSNPNQFLNYVRDKKINLVAAEIGDESKSLWDYQYSDEPVCILVGNESVGIPEEIVLRSEKVIIPMPGPGFCLNTAITANIMLHEYVKQRMQNGR